MFRVQSCRTRPFCKRASLHVRSLTYRPTPTLLFCLEPNLLRVQEETKPKAKAAAPAAKKAESSDDDSDDSSEEESDEKDKGKAKMKALKAAPLGTRKETKKAEKSSSEEESSEEESSEESEEVGLARTLFITCNLFGICRQVSAAKQVRGKIFGQMPHCLTK